MQANSQARSGDTLTAHFTLVTPMFLGGANQQTEEIRPPSVKGALRFWWRALNWGRHRARVDQDQNLSTPAQRDIAALKALHSEEARLFGASAQDGGGGQGVFLLTLKPETIHPIPAERSPLPGKAYLAGMGLKERQALPAGKEFEIILRFRPRTNPSDKKSLDDALRLFGLIGGLGSRNRRAFGSVTRLVLDSDQWRLPTEDEFQRDKEWLRDIIKTAPNGTAPFSAITKDASGFRGAEYDSADEAMETMGAVFSQCRSAIKADSRYVHTIASKHTLEKPPRYRSPQRAIFGLPHNYYFSSHGGKSISFDFVPSYVTGADENKANGRRASPLIMHIAAFTKDGQHKYQPLCLLLPAVFLPANEQIQVSVNGSEIGEVIPPTDYGIIRDFLRVCATAEI